MGIFQAFSGPTTYLTPVEQDRLTNPAKYNYSQAAYDAYRGKRLLAAEQREDAYLAAKRAVPYGYAAEGVSSTNPRFSLAGYGGHSGESMAGLAGLAGAARTSLYGDGGAVEEQGIGSLFETGPRAELIEPVLNPIVEHHLQNIADGKTVKRPNGTVSTVFTAQVDGLSGEGGRPTLIPTIWDGQELPLEDTLGVNGQMILGAIARAKASGKPWPTAATHEELREVDKVLHQDITLIDPEVAQKVLGEARRQQHEARRSGIGGLR